MKKKILIAAATLLLAAAAVFGGITLYHRNKTRTITDFYDNNPDTITKMTISCNNPSGTVEVPKQYYRQVTDMLATLKFPGVYENKNPLPDGGGYHLTIKDDKNGLSITPLGKLCGIYSEKNFYRLKGDLNKFLEELYQQLYPEHKIS